LSGTLNLAQSINQSVVAELFVVTDTTDAETCIQYIL